ncbi:hypothetical protein M2158_006723 [Streptomyces sp. SAI-144]|nr:hypothetical protein [Streptomyces sp. SAI-144]
MSLRRVKPFRPNGSALRRKEVQAGAYAVEGPLQHGGADAGAPQHAGIGTVGVRVGERADRDGRLGHGGHIPEMGESDDPGTHQRAVAGTLGVAGGVVAGGPQHRRTRSSGRTARGVQDSFGLVADIAGAPAQPALEVGRDRVEAVGVTQIGSGRRHLGDAHLHLGVVGVLAGGVRSQAAADHLRLLVVAQRRRELIGHAQRVAHGGPQQHTCGPIGSARVQAGVRRDCAGHGDSNCSAARSRPGRRRW